MQAARLLRPCGPADPVTEMRTSVVICPSSFIMNVFVCICTCIK